MPGFNANIDFIGQGGVAQGEVARKFASGRIDVGTLRPILRDNGMGSYMSVYISGDPDDDASYQNIPLQVNTGVLQRDEWKQLDTAVLEISRKRLGAIQDLRDNNLVHNLGNAMGTTVFEYHDISDAMEAEVDMDGVTRTPGDRVEFGTNYIPLPIIHSDFEINSRVLAASRNMGSNLDTANVEAATDKCWRKLEDMLVTNYSYTYGGGTINSYLSKSCRNTGSLTADWNDSAIEAMTNIKADVLAMKQASINDDHHGPWMLYVPTAYETVLDDDYVTTQSNTKTVRQRILEIEGIKGIKVLDHLTADNVLLVEMNKRTVRLINGLGMTVVQWKTEGEFITKFKVMCIQVPQIRCDQAGKSGIVHYS